MFSPKSILRIFAGTLLGAAPFLLLAWLGKTQIGLSLAPLGAFAGALLSLPGISAGRVLRLLCAMTVAKAIPPLEARLIDWADRAAPSEGSDWEHRFIEWLFVPQGQPRRDGIVVGGVAAGLLIGLVVAIHDFGALSQSGDGWMLPLPGSRDSHFAQAVLLTLAAAAWGGIAAACVASSAYRRPIFLAVAVAGLIGACAGGAIDDGDPPGPKEFAVFFPTVVAGLVLFVLLTMRLLERFEKPPPIMWEANVLKHVPQTRQKPWADYAQAVQWMIFFGGLLLAVVIFFGKQAQEQKAAREKQEAVKAQLRDAVQEMHEDGTLYKPEGEALRILMGLEKP